jgi:hypothetical protein
MLRQSRHLATRVENEGGPGAAGVDRAFALTFQRAPTANERRAAVNLVNEQGLFALCRALLNANEFSYLD